MPVCATKRVASSTTRRRSKKWPVGNWGSSGPARSCSSSKTSAPLSRKRRTILAQPAGDVPRRRSLRTTLKSVFGAEDFRPGQEAAVRSVMAGRDTVAIMPTGAGKSLCYQLPALHLPGVTVVVSPLISLMKDQTDKLQQRGIRAVQVNSALTAGESREALDALAGDRVEFVLTTPERLADEEFLELLGGKTVDVFVVDEAHCVSQWGHDFRPSYLALPRAIDKLGRPPVLAMTATAPPD